MKVKPNGGKIAFIDVRFIPHKDQRYDTVGDYFFTDKIRDLLQVRISKHKNWRYSWLVLIHELTEILLVLDQKIPFEKIDEFDFRSKAEDPGSDPKAPYHGAHMFALKIEKQICEKLGISWENYEKAL